MQSELMRYTVDTMAGLAFGAEVNQFVAQARQRMAANPALHQQPGNLLWKNPQTLHHDAAGSQNALAGAWLNTGRVRPQYSIPLMKVSLLLD